MILPGVDRHHVIEKPVYIEVDRGPRDQNLYGGHVLRDTQIIERPVYIETPIPVPFDRPYPVPMGGQQERRAPPPSPAKKYAAGPDPGDFPYHNPYPEQGAGFVDRRLEATNEADPLKAFMERMKPFG